MIDVLESGNVRELRLNRPPVNALNPELLSEISRTVRTAGEAGAGALVLSGRPGMFSAGLDIPSLLQLDHQRLRDGLRSFFDAMLTVASCPIPIVAAITGHAPAGGAIFAMFCDYRVMAEGPFSIGLNEVTIGIPMPRVVAELARRVVGVRSGERLCVTGELLKPDAALAVGLVDEVVAAEDVVKHSHQWARHMAELPAAAVRTTRQIVRADLVDCVERYREQDTEDLVEVWFRPEVQAPLQEMVRRLKKGQNKGLKEG